MNALYGRFGINPISTVSVVTNNSDELQKFYDKYGMKNVTTRHFNNDKAIASYQDIPDPIKRQPFPKIGAVQISAAISAYGRIYMYPYACREDCAYTDTDSVVVKYPLQEEDICSYTLGK